HSGGNGDINLFDTVVLEIVRERARSIRQAAYRCARAALTVGHERVTGAGELLGSPFFDELENATLAKTVGCNLRHEVTAGLVRGSNIHQKKCKSFALNLAAREQLDGRDADTFLEDFRRCGIHRARRHSADIDVVSHRGDQGDDLIVDKYRGNHAHIWKVGASDIRIIRH